MAPITTPTMYRSRPLLAALACLLGACSARDEQRENKPTTASEATPKEASPMATASKGSDSSGATPAARRPVQLRLTFTLTDAAGRGTALATRSGTIDVALPYFDGTSSQRAVVPITLEGGLAACISIDAFYRGDPKGDPPDSLVTTVRTRWEIKGLAPAQFQSHALGGALGGQPILGSSPTFRWADTEIRAQLALTATPSTNTAAEVPMMVAAGDATDSCVSALARRVISSIRDL